MLIRKLEPIADGLGSTNLVAKQEVAAMTTQNLLIPQGGAFIQKVSYQLHGL